MSGLHVIVWNENWHEHNDPPVSDIYPDGIHGAIAAGLTKNLGSDASIRIATLDQPDHGLAESVLAANDVLVWWGHMKHEDVSDEVVERVASHVLGGMGLVVLHSGHFSRIFKRLLGTSCSLSWKDEGSRELIWTVKPGHPIANGVDMPIVIDHHETYAEFFDIPDPDENIFISSFDTGEVFRSGVTFTRGRGRIFYFSPGDQAYPIYHHEQIMRVIGNGVRWAAPISPEHVEPHSNHLK